MKPHILSFGIDTLREKLLKICSKPFHVKQILRWIFVHHITDLYKMTNISKELQNKISDEFNTNLPMIIDIKKSTDNTTKFLLKLSDNELIEMVYMPGEKKNTICISTQVGCSRACSFCATAISGLKRNLYSEEIIAQLIVALNHYKDDKITNIVLMGMGEPLDNYENVVNSIKLISAESGFCYSGRRITLSTCGVVPKILELAESGLKIKLAVSLNSAINEKRSEIMPINDIYPLNELKNALLTFRKKTNFRITFEYIMIGNFNMGSEDIKALSKFCGDISCKINLINWNEVNELPWRRPRADQVTHFITALQHIPAAITLRKSRGEDIHGACGQLRGVYKDEH